MKLPSIKILLNKSTQTFLRFPLALTCAIIGSLLCIYIIENPEADYAVNNIIHTCFVGLSLLVGITLLSEKKQFNELKKWILNGVSILAMIGFYFYLPLNYSLVHIYRTIVLLIAIHLFISYISFIGTNSTNGFWQFNKTLFIRTITGLLYSFVLFVGLAIALIAIDQLFNANINEKLYLQLWVVIVGIFKPFFILSGIPEDTAQLETDTSYPTGLKIFTQYVLLPLVTIYFAILYAYMFKIVFLWELPKGWVSYLVIAFSTLGILSFLLVFPIQDILTNKWVKYYARIFYWALFPLIILLFIAIGKRVSEYGITENRYFIMVLALWLTGISVWMLFKKLKGIKMIPISLSIIALLTTFGPWGAFQVSKNSQMNRLKQLLITNNYFSNGKITKQETQPDFQTRQQITSIVDYLTDIHGVSIFKKELNINTDSIENNRHSLSSAILDSIGIAYTTEWAESDTSIYFTYQTAYKENNILEISGFDYFLDNAVSVLEEDQQTSSYPPIYKINQDTLMLIIKNKYNLQLIFRKDTMLFDIKDLIYKTYKNNALTSVYDVDPEKFVIESETAKSKVQIQVNQIYGYKDRNDSIQKINQLRCSILFRKKL